MSATSARIRTTTTCNERVATRRLVAGCDVRDPRVAPHARASHPSSRSQERNAMTDMSAQMKSDSDGNARPFAGRGAALPRHRPHRLPDRGRSVRDAGHPAVADAALQRDAGRDGLCGQCQHHGHGGRRARRRLSQPAYRPAARHSRQPRRCSRSRPRCSRSRPTSPSSRCCASRRACAWRRPSR